MKERQNMNNLVTKASELIYQMDNDQLNQVIEAIKPIERMARGIELQPTV